MSPTRQQKIRRQLAGYASNDNRIKRNYLKIISLIMLFIAIFSAFILWLQAFRPIENDTQNIMKIALFNIAEGEYKRVIWDEKPIIIHHRTQEEIQQTNKMLWQNMPDPEPIFARTNNPKWVVLLAQCQNLGCQPEFKSNHFICGCDNSFYDSAGRVTSGRSNKNIPIINWKFSKNQKYIIIGEEKQNEQ